jgi:hypothetical protein
VFVNITARDFCDWVVDPQGPPPAVEPVTVQVKETGKGALVASVKADDLNIEMWNFDEGVPPLVGPCEDIADQLAEPDAEPFATGTASYQGNDNDLMGGGTGGNSFGDSGRALVTGQDGVDYSYDWGFRVNSRCHAPEDGPPACLREHNVLEAI